jgi:hypothetical protein
MILEPRCFIRNCKYYLGVKQDNEDETTERNYCAAFPNMIPFEIAYDNNLHDKPFPGQDNNIIFERGD